MKAVIVVPTFNESKNLEMLVRRILALNLSSLSLLIVDDSSPDGTGKIADSLAAEFSGRINVMHRPGRLGLGSAYIDGFRVALAAGAEVICEMDSDGSHDPVVLNSLLGAINSGADLAIGSRRIPGGKIIGWAPHRHLMSTGAMGIARLILGLQTRDVTSGFRAYRRNVIQKLLDIKIGSNGYAFQEETLFHTERLNFKITEVPITFADRTHGKSKLTWKEIPEFFLTLARLRIRYGGLRGKA